MHPADIQSKIKKLDKTQKELAQEIGVSEMFISMCINKKSSSDRVMRIIAELIGEDAEDVFHEYYFNPKRRPRAA